jgi:hypothetical protein
VSADETGTAGNKYLLWRWHHIKESETNREKDRDRSGMFKEVRKKREIGNLSLSFIVLLDRFVLKSVLMTTHFFCFVKLRYFFGYNCYFRLMLRWTTLVKWSILI